MPKKLSLERMLGQERHLLALAVCVWEHELVDDVLGGEGAVGHGEPGAGGRQGGGGHKGEKEEEKGSKGRGDIRDKGSTAQVLFVFSNQLSHNTDLLG